MVNSNGFLKTALVVFGAGILLYTGFTGLGGTFTSFSDEETSRGNMFQTGGNDPPLVSDIGLEDGSAILFIGTVSGIEWTAIDPDGADDGLSIDLWFSSSDGYSWVRLPTNGDSPQGLENNGKYPWPIPNNNTLISNSCRIKVVATEKWTTGFGPLRGENISGPFKLVFPPDPVIEIVSPSAGEILNPGQICQVAWKTIWIDDPVRDEVEVNISFSPDGGVSWIQVATGKSCEGVCELAVPDQVEPANPGLIKVEAITPGGQTGKAMTAVAFGSPGSGP